eukprot:2685721-Pleurochrysis_carterae.AAC.1
MQFTCAARRQMQWSVQWRRDSPAGMASVAESSRVNTAAEKLEALRRDVNDTAKAKQTDGSSASKSTAVAAHENLLMASQSLAQAARTFHFVINMEPTEEEASSCTADLEEAACIYASWAVNFLGATGPAERYMARILCQEPLSNTLKLLTKVQRQEAIAVSDVVQVDACTEKLRGLAIDGRVAAARALLQNENLVRDSIRELQDCVDDAVQATAGGGSACSSFRNGVNFRGSDSDDDETDDLDDGDEVELIAEGTMLPRAGPLFPLRAAVALTAPLLDALDAAAELMNIGTEAAHGASSKIAGLLVTCAKALSAQVDNLVSAVHMDDAEAVQQYCTSLNRLLGAAYHLVF